MKFNKIDLNDGDVILREEGFHLMRVHEDFALAILYDIPLHDDPEPETIVQSMDQAALRSEISAGRTFTIPGGLVGLMAAGVTGTYRGVQAAATAALAASKDEDRRPADRLTAAEIALRKIVSAEIAAMGPARCDRVQAAESGAADGVRRQYDSRAAESVVVGGRSVIASRHVTVGGTADGPGTQGGAGPTPNMPTAHPSTRRPGGRDRRDAGQWRPLKGGRPD